MLDKNSMTDFQKLQLIKSVFKKGRRIKLYEMKGENLPFGLEGTIDFVDDAGQIHVNWDNGSTLALNDCDTFSLLS